MKQKLELNNGAVDVDAEAEVVVSGRTLFDPDEISEFELSILSSPGDGPGSSVVRPNRSLIS